MRVGVVSDTHNDLAAIDASVALFSRRKCEHLIHMGDVSDAKALFHFAPALTHMGFCWIPGNHDDFDELKPFSDALGATCASHDGDAQGHVRIGGVDFGMRHSTYSSPIPEWCRREKFDYVLYGHTHYFNLRFPSNRSRTVVLNPGGFYSGTEPWTVCVIDLAVRSVEVYTFIKPTHRFSLALSISLDDRLISHGPGFGEFSKQVCLLRKCRPRFWCDNRHLFDDEDSWIPVSALSRDNRAQRIQEQRRR